MPVALVAAVPFVLVVNAIAAGAQRRGSGEARQGEAAELRLRRAGAFHHLNAELFSSMTGIKMTHVPYRGSVPAMTDLVAGHIQVLFVDIGPAMELIRAGKVRVLGITSAERRRGRAGDSAAREGRRARLRHRRLADDRGAGRHAAADPEKLNAEINAIVNTEEVQKQIAGFGMIPIGKGSLGELDAYAKSETVRWGKVIRTPASPDRNSWEWQGAD